MWPICRAFSWHLYNGLTRFRFNFSSFPCSDFLYWERTLSCGEENMRSSISYYFSLGFTSQPFCKILQVLLKLKVNCPRQQRAPGEPTATAGIAGNRQTEENEMKSLCLSECHKRTSLDRIIRVNYQVSISDAVGWCSMIFRLMWWVFVAMS